MLSVLCLANAGHAQTALTSSVDSASRYEAFFRQVADVQFFIEHPDPPLKRNRRVVVPRIQDAIGLSDRETELLITLAQGCGSDLQRLPTHFPVIFDARIETLQRGRVSEATALQVQELEQKRIELIHGYVRRLETGLGSERFSFLDEYVRSSKWKTALQPWLQHR